MAKWQFRNRKERGGIERRLSKGQDVGVWGYLALAAAVVLLLNVLLVVLLYVRGKETPRERWFFD